MVKSFFLKSFGISNGLIFVRMPKYGLGNLLLIWAQAYVFSLEKKLPLYVSSWWSIKPGPLLRWEKQKRLYLGYFKNSGICSSTIYFFLSFFFKKIYNPTLNSDVDNKTSTATLYVFNELKTSEYMFSGLQIHRENISRAIFAMLTDPIKTKILTLSSPEIGVHIRRGDFKYGNLLTSNQFFINAINVIRKIEGRPLTVTVFTDAHDREIADILNLDDVQFPVDQSDIVDIYQLSKSKYLILSQSSSFSYWAAFLCNNIVIRHQDDWQKQICHNTSNELKFDGLNIELLMQDLLNLKQSSSFN